MDFTGKPMVGYVFVAPAAVSEEAHLERWVRMAAGFVATLPAKQPRPKAKKSKEPSRKPR